MCVCGHQDHRQHRLSHNAPGFHVRLHWSSAFQGSNLIIVLDYKLGLYVEKLMVSCDVLGEILRLHRSAENDRGRMQVRLDFRSSYF